MCNGCHPWPSTYAQLGLVNRKELMKRERDELPPLVSQKLRKCSDEDEPYTRRGEQKELLSSQELTHGIDLIGGSTENVEDSESSSLLDHQNPEVRLRALACLHAHMDLFYDDAAGTERLLQALHRQLHREDNVHVTQQLVRLLAQLVISACKIVTSQNIDLECNSKLPLEGEGGSNFGSILGPMGKKSVLNTNRRPQYEDEDDLNVPQCCIQSASKRASSMSPMAVLPRRGIAVQCVKMLLSYASAELESPTLKLQILRSLYQIAKEVSGVRCDLLHEDLPELVASSNSFVRAQTLLVIALSLVTDSGSNCLLDKEDGVDLFAEYTHDFSAVVRTASLHSIILLSCNGFLLTEGSYKAAIVLLDDGNENIRALALQVISSWVEQDPKERTNIAFLEVCKMMIDMELSVRIEACKAFLSMENIREDLLMQALCKKPLEFPNEVKEQQLSARITIPDSDVDISKYEEGLNILDRRNMGAFVHGIEDEFFEVRALMVNVLAHFCCVSTQTRATIKGFMMNLLNDDSYQVRSKAVQKLIHVARDYGLQVNDSDLHVVHGILEDADEATRNAGKNLLAEMQHLSVEGFKYTIESLLQLSQKNQQERDFWHALYKLGRAHSTFVQLLTMDFLIKLKACLAGEAGLDTPGCGCLLFLFVGASETNAKILCLVPVEILSLVQLLDQNSQLTAGFESTSTCSQVKMIKRYLGISTEHKEAMKGYLARVVRSSWNVKTMLVAGMFSRSRQILRGCRRDIRRLLDMLGDEDLVAQTTYVSHYVKCLCLVCEGWVHFQHEETSAASLPELACRLEFVVKCMQHTFIEHSNDQKLDLTELSMIPVLWRMIPIASRNDYRKLSSDVEAIKSTMKQSLSCTPFMEKMQKNLLESVTGSVDVQEVLRVLCSFFWPRCLTINYLREMKAVLSIPGNDLEHPVEFLPDMPFSITVRILAKNLDTGRIWVRVSLECSWTRFIFVDASECGRANSLVTDLHIPGMSVHSKCTLEAAVYLECPGDCPEAVRGPSGYLLPLTPSKLIFLIPALGALG